MGAKPPSKDTHAIIEAWGSVRGGARDRNLPDEDSAGHRRLRGGRAGRPEGRGAGRRDRLGTAPRTRRAGTELLGGGYPGLQPRALRADRGGVSGVAPKADLAGEGRG